MAADVLIDCSASADGWFPDGNIVLFVDAGSEGDDWVFVGAAVSCDIDSKPPFALEEESKWLISRVVVTASVDEVGAVVETAAMISMELSAGEVGS